MWLISVACSFTYLYVDFIKFTFVFANSIVLFTLTLLLLVNYKISRNLKSQRKLLQSLSDSEIVKSRLAQRDKKVNKVFLLFLVAFVIFNLPSMVISFILNFASTYSCLTHHILRDFQFISILFPSSVNPFIYSLRLPNIRIAVKAIGHRILPNLFNPEAGALFLWSSPTVSEKVGIGKQRVSPFVEVRSMAKQTVKNRTLLAGGIAKHAVPFRIVNSPSTGTGEDDNGIQWISDRNERALKRGTSHFYRETTNVWANFYHYWSIHKWVKCIAEETIKAETVFEFLFLAKLYRAVVKHIILLLVACTDALMVHYFSWLKKIIWVIRVQIKEGLLFATDVSTTCMCGSHLLCQLIVLVSWKLKKPWWTIWWINR